MQPEQYDILVAKAQEGDRRAMILLLRLAHTPVSFLCRKLLRNDQAAEALTRELLRAIPKQLANIPYSVDFETWVCRITASRCMQALSRMCQDTPDDATRPANPPRIPSRTLDEVQTAQVVQQLVDDLPDAPRICLLLYSCTGLKLKGIAQLTGHSESAVLEYLNLAQNSVKNQLRKYHRMGIHFSAIPPLSSLLHTAMQQSQDPKAAAVMVSSLIGKKTAPAAPRPKRAASRITPLLIAVIAAAALLLVMLVSIVFLESARESAQPSPSPVTEALFVPAAASREGAVS